MAKRWTLLPMSIVISSSLLMPGIAVFGQARHAGNDRFYNGASRGVHGGDYGRGNYHHDDRNRNQGGIGPGKGALIGGAAGAALGAVFGGGVKGSLITGAAGAGVGAILGQSAQNNRDRDRYYRR